MADKCVVNTIACFSRVKLSSRCLISVIPSRKEKELLCISSGDKFVYLIENGRHLNTYSFPSNIIHFEVLHQIITAITEDGRVWRTNVTKHKTKKIKHQETCSLSNQAIFSELLSKETKNHEQMVKKECSVHVTKVSASQTILFEPRIQAIFTLEESLISFGLGDSGCIISLYMSSYHHDNSIYCHQPALKYVFNFGIKVQSKTKMWPIPLLCYREKTSNSTNVIERKLFDMLVPRQKTDQFEMDSNTILLIGTPDGEVWVCDNSQNQTGLLENSKTIKDSLSQINLLCHLEQSVKAIHLAQLPLLAVNTKGTKNDGISGVGLYGETHKNNTDDSSQMIYNMVVMIGERGKCILVYQKDDKCEYSEHNLAGPIHCSSVSSSKDCILYSNGKEVCVTKFSFINNNTMCSEKLCVVLSPVCICIPDICCIHPLEHQNASNDDHLTSIRAVAITTRGKLLDITLPGPEGRSSSVLSKEPGLQLKELLVEIEKIALQTIALEKDLEAIDKVLEQLNYTATLISKMKRDLPINSEMVKSQAQQCIHWTVTPKLSSIDDVYTNNIQYVLKFKFHNQSNITLSNQCSILVSVHCGSSVFSHLMPLESLYPQSAKEFSLPLNDLSDLRHCIVVETFLFFDITSLLSTLPSKLQNGLDMNKSSLVISLGQNVIDVLSFASLLIDALSNTLCKFGLVNQQPLHLNNLDTLCKDSKGEELVKCLVDDELYTVVVPVSKSILSDITSIFSSHQVQNILTNMTVAPDRSEERDLFHFLLEDLNDCRHPNQDTRISTIITKTTDKLNLTVQVKAEGKFGGLDILLKASNKNGLLMLLESVIARLRPVWLHSRNMTHHGVGVDDLQRILQIIQDVKSNMEGL